MAVIRIPHAIWKETHDHLFDKPGEHFAFFLADWSSSNNKPVFLVKHVLLISDSLLSTKGYSYEISIEGILLAVNTAIKDGLCLIEIHNHGGSKPRWSNTDQIGFDEFVGYIHESLRERPYAATVWGDETIFGEYFLPNGNRGLIRSITVIGDRYSQLISRDDDLNSISKAFDRQIAWFTERGQQQLSRYNIGIVGLGGTGSHIVQQLVYLGCRNFTLIDFDYAEETNSNRLITSTPMDMGVSKTELAEQLINGLAPEAQVITIIDDLQSNEALDALKGVDFIFGCVDNDGARLILNELALAYFIPFLDLATGISVENGKVTAVGGRLIFVLPDGPCLYCLGEIDPQESAFYLSNKEEREFNIRQGYITGVDIPNPSVVSLNGMVASAAINEFAIFISGIRLINTHTSVDVLGNGRKHKSQWVTPTISKKEPSCVQCTLAGIGDLAGIERYAKDIKMNKEFVK